MPCLCHFTPGKVTWYPLYRRVGGPQGQSGRCGNSHPPPPRIRSPERPAHSRSLHKLRYPDTPIICSSSMFVPLTELISRRAVLFTTYVVIISQLTPLICCFTFGYLKWQSSDYMGGSPSSAVLYLI